MTHPVITDDYYCPTIIPSPHPITVFPSVRFRGSPSRLPFECHRMSSGTLDAAATDYLPSLHSATSIPTGRPLQEVSVDVALSAIGEGSIDLFTFSVSTTTASPSLNATALLGPAALVHCLIPNKKHTDGIVLFTAVLLVVVIVESVQYWAVHFGPYFPLLSPA